MNIYYAIGGGLGHLTRARAFLRQMNIEHETAILTSSEFSNDPRLVGNIEVIGVDPDFSQDKDRFRIFLKETFDQTNCENLYLDAFPFGISGELANFEFGEINVFYVARRLKLEKILNLDFPAAKPFSKTFLLESLGIKHLEFIKKNSLAIELLDLKYSEENQTPQNLIRKIIENHSPFWLIVHSGNEFETSELFEYAKEIQAIEKSQVNLVLISPNECGIENTYNLFPAYELFPFAEKIFTACGFNSMKQTEPFREKHLFIPFNRRFDDQFARAEFARSKFNSKSSQA